MHHLLGKARSDGTPEHKEDRTAEEFDRRNIAEHMHDTQAVDADHQDEQQARKSETAVYQKMRQIGSGQTQHIAYCLAVRYTLRATQRQDILVIRTGKKEADIREQCEDGEHE